MRWKVRQLFRNVVAAGLAMGKTVGDRAGRRADIHVGNKMLELVMSGLVEEVADRDHSGSFSGEVHGKRGRGAAEHTDDGIQLLAAILEIGTRHGEISAAGCGHGNEKNLIFSIQKFVGLKSRLWHDSRRDGNRLSGSGRRLRCRPLRHRGGAERKEKKRCGLE